MTIRFVTISCQPDREVQTSTDKCRQVQTSTDGEVQTSTGKVEIGTDKTRLGSKNAVSTIHCFYELYTSPHPEIQPSQSIYTTKNMNMMMTILPISDN